ncbi:MAG: hypothetical protein ACK4OM_01190 [Alphaproteobacteria bacterium]
MSNDSIQIQRGKLKIFLGFAPGVGKTYSMLKAAKSRKEENIDVIIGLVETHERNETKALLNGFEILDLKSILYKELIFWELDLEKIIERKPQIVIIDELAHSNVKGSKHTKRYLDIEEILAAGIDVYTCLNIQHLESLNNLVSEILQIHIHETVPDYIIKNSDEIELIDLPPNELRKRLKEGKIYKKEKIEQALDNFFSIEKLIALREIALSYTAQSVNAQMLSHKHSQQAKNFHPTRERLMVCIDNSDKAFKLIRECCRAANFNKISWLTLHIDVTDTFPILNNINKAMQLTEDLGGKAVIIKGQNVIDDIIATAAKENITRIIVGKKYFRWWDVTPSIADQLITKSEVFEISIVPIQTQNINAKKINYSLKNSNLLKFLKAIFFFILFSYGIYSIAQNVAAEKLYYKEFSFENGNRYLVVYLGIIWGIFSLIKKCKTNLSLINQTRNFLNNLHEFIAKLMDINNIKEIILPLEEYISKLGYNNISIMLVENGKLINYVKNNHDNIDYKLAEWSWLHNKPSGATTSTFPDSKWFTIPICNKKDNFGILALYVEDNKELTFQRKKLLQIICNLTAITIQNPK